MTQYAGAVFVAVAATGLVSLPGQVSFFFGIADLPVPGLPVDLLPI